MKGESYQYTWSPVNVMITAWVLISEGIFLFKEILSSLFFFVSFHLLHLSFFSVCIYFFLFSLFVQVFIHLIPSIFQPVAGEWNARNFRRGERVPSASHDYQGLTIDFYFLKRRKRSNYTKLHHERWHIAPRVTYGTWLRHLNTRFWWQCTWWHAFGNSLPFSSADTCALIWILSFQFGDYFYGSGFFFVYVLNSYWVHEFCSVIFIVSFGG